MTPRKVAPNAPVSGAMWNALIDMLGTPAGTVTGTTFGELGMGRTAQGGVTVFDQRQKSHWAKLTARGTGNRYAHNKVANNADGTFTDLPQDADNPYGTTSELWAAEVNGNVSFDSELPVYTRVWPNPTFADKATDPAWLFEYAAGSDAGAACEAAGCDGLVGLEEEWCLRMTLACHEGRFADMDEDQFAAVFGWYDETEVGWVFYVWNPEVPDWVEFEMDWGGGTGVPVLTFEADGTPVLTVDQLTLYYEPCTTGGRFSGGPRNGFTGGTAPELCEPNAFTVVVECSCCPIDGWQGDGWYCVLDTGEDCGDLENACVELLEENGDHCDDEDAVTICSGPYATQEECEGACVALGAAPSCTDAPASGVAATLYYRIDAPSGVAACADGQTGTMLEGTDTWSASAIGPGGCGATNDMTLRCDVTYPDEWELSVATTFGGCGVYGGNVAASAGTASPFTVQFVAPACWFLDATGNETDTVTITVSEVPL